MQEVVYKDLRMIDYGECWALQEQYLNGLVEAKKNTTPGAEQVLILCEHPHVYTIGKSGKDSNMLIGEDFLKNIGATYYHIDRGGDVTYHGPGQIVGYPIVDLERLGIGVREYINQLEQSVIESVADFGVEAGRMDGAAGVWVQRKGEIPRKICAIGVRCTRFVTMHGFALNVNTDLCYFGHINPCGFVDRGVTSLARELGTEVDMALVRRALIDRIEKNMNIKIKIEKVCQ